MSATLCPSFTLPEDGWFHIATPGEWPHKPTGLLQVLDEDAMQSIVASFGECSQQANWPGVLIDFDHQSLDVDKPSVAAGWIVSLEKRPTGIWAQIRWSDLGKTSIEGGRYRFISPVWRSTDCALMGDDRIRPLKLMNCAVTNDPNIKGLFPLSNTDTAIPMRFAPPAIPIVPPSVRMRKQGSVLLRNAALRSGYNPRNDRALTESQLRFLHARRGGGGSGGGGGGNRSSTTASSPSVSPPPSSPSGTPRYARDHEARLASLEQQRNNTEERYFGTRPERKNFDPIDVRAVQRQAMAEAKSSTEVIAAVNQAKATNAQRKAELDAIKSGIRKQYTTPEARERALERHMRGLDEQFAKDTKAYEREEKKWASELSELDDRITEEQLRQNDSERRAAITEAEQQAKAKQQAIKDQIAADKEAARVKLAREREKKKAEVEPIRQYKTELQRRAAYVDAIRRGDDDYAEKLAPEADHAKMRSTIAAITSADPDSSDYRKIKIHLDELKSKPLPKRVEE